VEGVVTILAVFLLAGCQLDYYHDVVVLVDVEPETVASMGSNARLAEVVVEVSDAWVIHRDGSPHQETELVGRLCGDEMEDTRFQLAYSNAGCALASDVRAWLAPSSYADDYEVDDDEEHPPCGQGNNYSGISPEADTPPDGASVATGMAWADAGHGMSCRNDVLEDQVQLKL